MNGICEDCFKREEIARHNDISHVHMTEYEMRCTKCGKVCHCVDDFYFIGSNPGTDWLKRHGKRWKEFKK
jgi:hypothetical protein